MSIERRIITGIIVSTEFIQETQKIWNTQLLESSTARQLAGWVLEYYEKYNKAPEQNIQSIYYAKAEGLQKDMAEDIEEILDGLSDEYENEKFNLPYLLDQTRAYFKEKHLSRHSDEIKGYISEGDLLEAEKIACDYKPLSNESGTDLDLSSTVALKRVEKAFKEASQPLIRYPRQLGEFWSAQLVRGSLVALMASEKRGKCLPGNQQILMSNGELLSVSEVVQQKRSDVISFDENTNQFISTKITHFWSNGIKPVYQIKTRTGRTVQTTYNHPFLTPNGWMDLSSIKKGGFIAVPKNLPVFGTSQLNDIKIKLIAYFITEGCLREYNYNDGNGSYKVIGFTAADLDIQNDFTRCIHQMNCEVTWKGIDARVINSKINKGKHNKNYLLRMLKRYKLFGKLSYDKTIPNIIFRLPKEKLALFLRILFTCDGWVNKDGSQIGFGVANKILAQQVQCLLTRFGIVSKLSWGANDKKGSWTVSIRDYENIKKFADEINFIFSKKEKMKKALILKRISYKSFLDKFPPQIADRFFQEVKKELGGGQRIEKGSKSIRSQFHTLFKNAGFVKGQIQQKKPVMRQSFLQVKDTKTGNKYFNSSILWDEIISIDYVGDIETFDLTIDKYHNFVAENILVHNTFWLLDMSIRACSQRSKVAFFQAGDMTEGQQLKRLCTYLTKKSSLKKYSGKMHQPVRDCIYNQMNTCDKEERECDFGVFDDKTEEQVRSQITLDDLKEQFKKNPDYIPCHYCEAYKHKKYGAAWLESVDTGNPLTVKEAQDAVEAFFINNKRRFKLSSHANGTLSIKQIKALLDIWEKQDDFVPDVIVIDYADLLVAEGRVEFRHQQNEIWKGMRNLSQERHCLVLTATQADANSYEQNRLKLKNFSEDKRKYAHVTACYGLNQDTKDREKKIGIMRINEIVIREGDFSNSSEVTVLQKLERGRPFLSSYW